MLKVAGYSIEVFDLDEIIFGIEQVDRVVACQFRLAPSQAEEIYSAERRALAGRNEALVAPFLSRIEAYVEKFSDSKLYHPGAGYVYPSQRHWMRVFLKEYVMAHRALPTGIHHVRVVGYSGGEHDFSDLQN
jgi:hypothetical protein